MARTPHELDRLLARGGLSGAERDRLFEAAAAAVVPTRARPWRLLAGLLVGLGAAAGATLVLQVPRGGESGFRAKGAGGVGTAPWIEMTCLGGSLRACPPGSTLVFSASEQAGKGFLAAYAEPRGGGERIFYFSADSESPAVEPTPGVGVLFRRGIRVGSEHQPGAYLVHAFLLERPLGKEALVGKPSGVKARADLALTVTTK